MTQAPTIETISFITSDNCRKNDCPFEEKRFDLTSFKSLRNFSWQGIQSAKNIRVLQPGLKVVAANLKSLRLDISSLQEICSIDELLAFSSPLEKNKFPNLKSLHLSRFSFLPNITKLVEAFNCCGLESLVLRHCHGIPQLLKALAESKVPVRLKSLELMFAPGRGGDKDSLVNFLGAFRGLEKLSLLTVNAHEMAPRYWTAAFRHKSTLKSFVYQFRSAMLPNRAYDCDLNGPPLDLCVEFLGLTGRLFTIVRIDFLASFALY